MKPYSFLTEILDPTVKWTHNGQYKAVEEILKLYPTADEFKTAVLRTENPKAIKLIQNLPDECDRNEYIDFLSKVYVKYSKLGKFLLALGIGAASSALVTYLSYTGYQNTKNRNIKGLESHENDLDKMFNINADTVLDYNDKLHTAANNDPLTYNMNKDMWMRHRDAARSRMDDIIKDLNVVKSNLGYLKNGQADKDIRKASGLNGVGAGAVGTGVGALTTAALGKMFDRKRVDDLKGV